MMYIFFYVFVAFSGGEELVSFFEESNLFRTQNVQFYSRKECEKEAAVQVAAFSHRFPRGHIVASGCAKLKEKWI